MESTQVIPDSDTTTTQVTFDSGTGIYFIGLVIIALLYRIVTVSRVDRGKLQKQVSKLEKQIKQLDSSKKQD